MTQAVLKLANQIRLLPPEELAELLAWLAEFERQQEEAWDREIERDSQPGGKLDAVLQRVRRDVAEGRTKPLRALPIERCLVDPMEAAGEVRQSVHENQTRHPERRHLPIDADIGRV